MHSPAHLFSSIDWHHMICPDASHVFEEYKVASFDELYAVYQTGLNEQAELQRRADEKNSEHDVMFKHISPNTTASVLSAEIDAYIAAAPLSDDVPPLASASADDNFFPSYVGYGKFSEAGAQACGGERPV